MRFRTKLFLSSAFTVLLLLIGTTWPIQRLIWANFDHLASTNFSGTRQALRSQQAEHVSRMRQVGKMVMEIPELRALIAEHNFEVSSDNLNNLQDRLDGLTEVMDVGFMCVLDSRGSVIAQNASSPWQTLVDIRGYAADSVQARALIHNIYHQTSNQNGEYGLWLYRGQLYQVVGLPLIFGIDQPNARADGALIMAAPVTAEMAHSLASSHNCEISFLTNDGGTTSSLPPALSKELRRNYDQNDWKSLATFDTPLGKSIYRSYVEPLVDPSSKTILGATLIQTSIAEESALQWKITRSLIAIMVAGLLLAALVSFVLSGAVTRPVRALLKGVKRVAGGDLTSKIPVNRHDEIGELATAFNDMVVQLQARRELERRVEETQAATKAKSQFLANMSHEIRTPLHGVIGMANLLLGTELSQRQRHYAQLVKTSTEVLTTLINDVLDFSKIEAGKLELETVEFNLHSVVEDVVELLYQKAEAKGVEIVSDIGGDVPMKAAGDPTRLRQILLNLIGNAVKFTDTGLITVRVSRDNSGGNSMFLRFEIIDTGIGISPDGVDRLFKSFSQVDASTTRRFGGTGLGLAISKQLCELMGGRIGVESQVGRGSNFSFTAKMQSTAAVPAGPPSHLAGMRVLVVVANVALREILTRQLAALAMEATSLATADEVSQHIIDAAAAGRPIRIVVVGRNVDRIASIVETARSNKVGRILLGATTENDDRQVLQKAGFDASIAKPVRRALLLTAIDEALGIAHPNPLRREAASIQPPTNPANKSIRILVAEDNEINQIVAAEFLNKAGFESHIVTDGQKAVEAFYNGQYDLVLMDCQMPVMDGFQATREIRQREKAAGNSGSPVRQVPIIALTANASGADRGRCLEAGMNAYCGKPFREQELLDTIASLLPERTSSPQSPASETTPADNSTIPLDISALLGRCGSNTDLALKILDKFEKQADGLIAKIKEELLAGNGEQLARAAHSMKGSAGVIAAEPLRLALAEIEQAGRQNALESGEKCLARLQQELARCRKYIPQAQSELQATAKKSR